jgi:hypothetical protein
VCSDGWRWAPAALNLIRPSIFLMTIAIAAAGFGLVLHNTDLAGLAAACSFSACAARPGKRLLIPRDKPCAEPQRLPIGEGLAERNIRRASTSAAAATVSALGRTSFRPGNAVISTTNGMTAPVIAVNGKSR